MNILENINLDLVGYLVTVNTPITRITLNQERLVALTDSFDPGVGAQVKKTQIVCPSATASACTLDGTTYKTRHCPVHKPRLDIED